MEETNTKIKPCWKHKKIIILVSIAALSIIGAVIFSAIVAREKSKIMGQNSAFEETKRTEEKTAETKKTAQVPESNSKLFVFLKDKNKSEEKQLFTLPQDFYSENVGGVENNVDYKNGNLYIIRKMSDSGDSELWKYGKMDKFGKIPDGTMLYSGKIFRFNVSSGGKYIAITTTAKEKLVIIDGEGNIMKEFNTQELRFFDGNGTAYWFGLWNWTRDDKEFWGTLGTKPISEALYKINTDTWTINKYVVPFDQEWDLNVNKKKIIYSDCPLVSNEASTQNLVVNGTKVNLMIYDIPSGMSSIIESTVSKCFSPKWINDDVAEYNDPVGSGKTSKIIK
jgi:hypothetical protein